MSPFQNIIAVAVLITCFPTLGISQTKKSRVIGTAMSKAQTRGQFDGNYYANAYSAIVLMPANKERVKKTFGISEDQIQALKQKADELRSEVFDRELWLSIEKKTNDDPDYRPTREEQKALEAMFGKQFGDAYLKKVFESVLDPSQMKKIDDFVFICRGGIRYPRHDEKTLAFLDLDDEQKAAIKSYRDETKEQREALVEEWGEMVRKKSEEEPGFDWDEAVKNFDRQRKELDKDFAVKLREILTEDQIMRAEIIYNKPSFYTEKEDVSWMPGLDSWKPGDPIPKEFLKDKQNRKPRFPQKK